MVFNRTWTLNVVGMSETIYTASTFLPSLETFICSSLTPTPRWNQQGWQPASLSALLVKFSNLLALNVHKASAFRHTTHSCASLFLLCFRLLFSVTVLPEYWWSGGTVADTAALQSHQGICINTEWQSGQGTSPKALSWGFKRNLGKLAVTFKEYQ